MTKKEGSHQKNKKEREREERKNVKESAWNVTQFVFALVPLLGSASPLTY